MLAALAATGFQERQSCLEGFIDHAEDVGSKAARQLSRKHSVDSADDGLLVDWWQMD